MIDLLSLGEKVSTIFEHCTNNNFVCNGNYIAKDSTEELQILKLEIERKNIEIMKLELERDRTVFEMNYWKSMYESLKS